MCCASPGTQDLLHQRRVWLWVQGFHPNTEWKSDWYFLASRGLCVPPRIWLPRPSLTHHQTCQAEQCCRQDSVLLVFSRLFDNYHRCSEWNLLSSVKNTGHQWWSCHFGCSLANASGAPRCWTVSTGPTTGRCALRPPSWSLFPILWPFTPVARRRSFCTQCTSVFGVEPETFRTQVHTSPLLPQFFCAFTFSFFVPKMYQTVMSIPRHILNRDFPFRYTFNTFLLLLLLYV